MDLSTKYRLEDAWKYQVFAYSYFFFRPKTSVFGYISFFFVSENLRRESFTKNGYAGFFQATKPNGCVFAAEFVHGSRASFVYDIGGLAWPGRRSRVAAAQGHGPQLGCSIQMGKLALGLMVILKKLRGMK